MRCKSLVLVSLPFFLLLAACARDDAPASVATQPESSKAEPASPPAVPDGHSSRIALDWAGTYSGILPCASCPGIETRVTLHEDGTFERAMLYIDEAQVPETDSGAFTWNSAGGAISLDAGGGESQLYQVGENVLFHLDRSGERITGDLAGRYVLHKHVRDPAIEDRRWRLVELLGQPIAADEARGDAVLTLRAGDSAASGNSSCNTFSGQYAIKSGQRLSFGRNMAVTLMACPDMSLESAFLDVLKRVDSYAVSDEGLLSLHRARMAPLARFEEAR